MRKVTQPRVAVSFRKKTWKYRLVGRSRPIGFANNYQNADAVPAFQVNELMFYFSFKF